MNKKLYALTLITLAVTGNALAADPRIREVVYDRNKVYTVYTAIGFASLIQFAPGEWLDESKSALLGFGDADAWNVGVSGNNITVKPGAKLPQTNVIVVTNKRTYAFDLRLANQQTQPTYIMRFTYPEDHAAEIAAIQRKLDITAKSRAEKWTVNTNYIWKGRDEDAALAPGAAWDDGRFTRLEYNHAGELPVFYKVMPDGTEALLNYNIDDKSHGTVVLQEVARTVRARLNKQVIEIHNRGYKLPGLNETGAGEHGARRVITEDAL
jgi:type IV secretion system protein VirB9